MSYSSHSKLETKASRSPQHNCLHPCRMNTSLALDLDSWSQSLNNVTVMFLQWIGSSTMHIWMIEHSFQTPAFMSCTSVVLMSLPTNQVSNQFVICQQMRPVRIELTTLGLWDPRATNCAIAAWRICQPWDFGELFLSSCIPRQWRIGVCFTPWRAPNEKQIV